MVGERKIKNPTCVGAFGSLYDDDGHRKEKSGRAGKEGRKTKQNKCRDGVINLRGMAMNRAAWP